MAIFLSFLFCLSLEILTFDISIHARAMGRGIKKKETDVNHRKYFLKLPIFFLFHNIFLSFCIIYFLSFHIISLLLLLLFILLYFIFISFRLSFLFLFLFISILSPSLLSVVSLKFLPRMRKGQKKKMECDCCVKKNQ